MNLVNELISRSKSICLIDGKDKLTYEEVHNYCLSISNGLIQDQGIKPGDRIVIIANNSVEFIIAYLAILACGAVAIPLDPFSSEPELARDISLVRPKLIFASSIEKIPGSYKETISSIEFNSNIWRKYKKMEQANVIDRSDKDIAVMLMTSSSSFGSRPAMLTHKSITSNLHQAKKISDLNIDEDDVVLCVMPLNHVFGLNVVCSLALSCSAQLLIVRSFDAFELSKIISLNQVTIVPGVPALYNAFIDNKNVTIDLFSNVKLLLSAGAPLRNEIRKKFFDSFGFEIAEGYGLTEASPMVSFCFSPKVEGDIGQALDGIEIEIRDSDGAIAVDGDIGEIVIRGENVFAGYFGESEATNAVLDSNGWLYTGDVGVKDQEDTIILIDRTSDVIVVSGFSVYPSEVESLLLQHKLVESVSVVGESNVETGEIVVAYVGASTLTNESDPKDRRALEKELREFCKDKIARYKIPSRFIFNEDNVINASSRPLRKSLRSAISNIE